MADKQADSHLAQKPWILTIIGSIGIVLLLLLPVVPLFRDAESMPDLAKWMGQFHPVLLHLPIGIFILILFQEIVSFFRPNSRETEVGIPLILGVFSSIGAVIAGYMLWFNGDGAYGDIGERHLWSGTVFASATILVAILKKWSVTTGLSVAAYKVPLWLSVGIMFFTSHDGGTMTHGAGFLTRYSPFEEKKSDDKEEPVLAEPEVFANVIQPIIEKKCVQCHKEGKAKGRFRMDTYDLLVKGGKEGAGLVHGDVAGSNIVVRIELPMDDEEHMPPEGKTDVTDEELAVIRWWIEGGASEDQKVSEAEMSSEIEAIVSKLVTIEVPNVNDQDAQVIKKTEGPDKAVIDMIAKITGIYPGTLTFESQKSAGVVLSAVSLRSKMTDAEFADFTPAIPHLVSADLSATTIGDSSVAKLVDASQLKMLRLGQTKITDASMDAITALSELESLNLYGTQITDASVEKLATLPNLKKLYLWQTKVTQAGVAKIKEALPDCEVILGAK